MKRFIAVAMSALSACMESGVDRTAGQTEVPKAELPALNTLSLCADHGKAPEELSLCSWALAPDILVWGTIESLESVQSPSVVASSDGRRLVDKCSGVVNPGLRIDLTVESYLRGSGPEKLSVFLGWEQIEAFRPMPALDRSSGKLVW